MTESMVLEDKLTTVQRRWLEHIRQQRQSGLSVAAYARQQDFAIGTFYTMRRRLLPLMSAEASAQRPLFQAVTLLQDQQPIPDSLTLTFDLPGGLRCAIQADVTTGAALLQALVRRPS